MATPHAPRKSKGQVSSEGEPEAESPGARVTDALKAGDREIHQELKAAAPSEGTGVCGNVEQGKNRPPKVSGRK